MNAYAPLSRLGFATWLTLLSLFHICNVFPNDGECAIFPWIYGIGTAIQAYKIVQFQIKTLFRYWTYLNFYLVVFDTIFQPNQTPSDISIYSLKYNNLTSREICIFLAYFHIKSSSSSKNYKIVAYTSFWSLNFQCDQMDWIKIWSSAQLLASIICSTLSLTHRFALSLCIARLLTHTSDLTVNSSSVSKESEIGRPPHGMSFCLLLTIRIVLTDASPVLPIPLSISFSFPLLFTIVHSNSWSTHSLNVLCSQILCTGTKNLIPFHINSIY